MKCNWQTDNFPTSCRKVRERIMDNWKGYSRYPIVENESSGCVCVGFSKRKILLLS